MRCKYLLPRQRPFSPIKISVMNTIYGECLVCYLRNLSYPKVMKIFYYVLENVLNDHSHLEIQSTWNRFLYVWDRGQILIFLCGYLVDPTLFIKDCHFPSHGSAVFLCDKSRVHIRVALTELCSSVWSIYLSSYWLPTVLISVAK